MTTTQEITNLRTIRIIAILVYAVNCAYAIHRQMLLSSGHTIARDYPYPAAAIFVGAGFASWWFCRKLPRAVDRLAAILFGAFSFFRVTMQFSPGVYLPSLNGVSCAVILLGFVAMLVGVFHCSPTQEP